MNAATNQPSILTLRLGQSDQAGHIDAVKLENRFGNINPECGNGHSGRFLPVAWFMTNPAWHIAMPLVGAVHPISLMRTRLQQRTGDGFLSG